MPIKLNQNLRRDIVLKKDSFASIDKDMQIITESLFLTNRDTADKLKSLLLVPHKNCISEINNYKDLLDNYSISKLFDEKFLNFSPKWLVGFNGTNQTSIIFGVDVIAPLGKQENFIQYTLSVFCMCNLDIWSIDNYQQRPLKMCGVVNGVLEGARLSGIGKLSYGGTSRIVVNERIGGYVNTYIPVITKEEDKLE